MNFEARDLVVRYRRGARPALDGADVDVPTGCLYAVLGPNGSGKSTLMRALLGLVPAESGAVSIDGRSVGSWRRAELARAIGAVPQVESTPFPVTVRELVAMGRYPHLGPLGTERRADRDAVEGALEECAVADVADRDVGTLSGGEAQRARIARALAQSPRALVLDEPTANLDVRHEMEILGLLRRRADTGTTVILITHRLNVAARFADRLLVLESGKVAGEGEVDAVFTPGLLERVYRWRFEVARDPATGRPRASLLDRPPADEGSPPFDRSDHEGPDDLTASDALRQS